jgi:hypothetical protein
MLWDKQQGGRTPPLHWVISLRILNIKPQKKSICQQNYGNAIITNTSSATNNRTTKFPNTSSIISQNGKMIHYMLNKIKHYENKPTTSVNFFDGINIYLRCPTGTRIVVRATRSGVGRGIAHWQRTLGRYGFWKYPK